jgi:hypothetical protein
MLRGIAVYDCSSIANLYVADSMTVITVKRCAFSFTGERGAGRPRLVKLALQRTLRNKAISRVLFLDCLSYERSVLIA